MGNTVVLKPASYTTYHGARFRRHLQGGRLPSGVVNIVTGNAGEVGDRLLTHPDVNKIAFTGSTDNRATYPQSYGGQRQACVPGTGW